KAAGEAMKAGTKFDDLDASRAAIRDKIEGSIKEFVGVGGIFTYSPTDHLGLDERSTFIAVVKDGEFRLYDSK
ncbi:MAG: branched-chain amino acid ABC transporter substrate-binding protein, partial [Rubrivivax sp.]|nr:branched-chain amino acid ABC transporter substrate-binding protein [Rubrivivax sp.]